MKFYIHIYNCSSSESLIAESMTRRTERQRRSENLIKAFLQYCKARATHLSQRARRQQRFLRRTGQPEGADNGLESILDELPDVSTLDVDVTMIDLARNSLDSVHSAALVTMIPLLSPLLPPPFLHFSPTPKSTTCRNFFQQDTQIQMRKMWVWILRMTPPALRVTRPTLKEAMMREGMVLG